MIFYNAEDCRGPSGLVMTDHGSSTAIVFEKTKPISQPSTGITKHEALNPKQVEDRLLEKTKPILKWVKWCKLLNERRLWQ